MDNFSIANSEITIGDVGAFPCLHMNCPSQGRRPCEVENILLGWPLCDGLPGAAWDWEVSSRSSRDESRGRQSNADADSM